MNMKGFKNWQTYILLGLLLVHSVWITYHLSLVARGAVNPWKMGGYAMYTKPSSGVDVVVNVIKNTNREDKTDTVIPGTYRPRLLAFYRKNWDFNLYCKPVTAASLIQLFSDNPRFENEDLFLELFAYRLQISPLSQNPEKIAEVEVFWQDQNSFSFQTNTCGSDTPERFVQYR